MTLPRPVALALPFLLLLPGRPALAQETPATRPAASLSPSPLLLDLLADAPPVGGVVARYDRDGITPALGRDELVEFLIQTRGLDAMLNLMQLRLAQALAAKDGLAVTPADIEAETRQTLQLAFANQPDVTEAMYPELLEQLLAQQQLSRAEFDVTMATNAYLKALARPRVRAVTTDENLRRYFDVRYGSQVKVRHIQLDDLAAAAQARGRVEAGEEFASVAAQISTNPRTKQLGGLLPPFALGSDMPEAFKAAAFALEPGQVSEGRRGRRVVSPHQDGGARRAAGGEVRGRARRFARPARRGADAGGRGRASAAARGDPGERGVDGERPRAWPTSCGPDCRRRGPSRRRGRRWTRA